MAIILESEPICSDSAATEIVQGVELATAELVDLQAAREAVEQEARKIEIAKKFQEMAQRDFDKQIMKQPGGLSIWSNRMGQGPISYEGAAEYRNGWNQAVENQRVAGATEQAS